MENEKFIVKAQTPVATNDPKAGALIYNSDRSINVTIPLSDKLYKKMAGAKKQFFYATLSDGRLVLDRKAPWQDW